MMIKRSFQCENREPKITFLSKIEEILLTFYFLNTSPRNSKLLPSTILTYTRSTRSTTHIKAKRLKEQENVNHDQNQIH